MIKKYLVIIIVLIWSSLFFISCSSCHNIKSNSSKTVNSEITYENENKKIVIKENRSIVKAKVLDIVGFDENRFYLKLKILKSEDIKGYSNFASKGDEIRAYPNYVRKEGQKQIDYSLEPNNNLLLAQKLTDNDIIDATVFMSGVNNTYMLINWNK